VTRLADGFIAIWVLSFLSCAVIALAQDRRVWPWLLLALAAGPLAPATLLARRRVSAGTVELCAECFARLAGESAVCARCRTQGGKIERSAWHRCH
jgi:hypothetical protein